MRTPQEIRDTEFQKSVSGYRTGDVEMFLGEVADEIESILQKKAETERRLAEIMNENRELKDAQSSINNVLISAQKLADQIIADANVKAAEILAETNSKADQMLKLAQEQVEREQQRAQQVRSNSDEEMERILHNAVVKSESMIAAAHDSVARQQLLFDKLKLEIVAFKKDIISKYKEQLESISTLPDEVPFDSARAADAMAFSWEQQPDLAAIKSAVVEETQEEVFEKPVEVEVVDEPIPTLNDVAELEQTADVPTFEVNTAEVEEIFAPEQTDEQPEEGHNTLADEPFFQSGRLSFGEEEEPRKKSFFKR